MRHVLTTHRSEEEEKKFSQKQYAIRATENYGYKPLSIKESERIQKFLKVYQKERKTVIGLGYLLRFACYYRFDPNGRTLALFLKKKSALQIC